MASSAMPSFPNRPYAAQQPKNNINQAPLGFGASSRDRQAQILAQQQQHQQQAQQIAQQGSVAQLTDEQREEVNEAFSLFDLDKDSEIDFHEFRVALKALGFDLPKPELLTLLTTHGQPPPSYPKNQQPPPSRLHLSLPAFQIIAADLIARRDPREEILRAFNLFDSEGKGMISLEDLRRVARELGEGLEEDELAAMIEEFDLEGKGGVGREEFVEICMG